MSVDRDTLDEMSRADLAELHVEVTDALACRGDEDGGPSLTDRQRVALSCRAHSLAEQLMLVHDDLLPTVARGFAHLLDDLTQTLGMIQRRGQR